MPAFYRQMHLLPLHCPTTTAKQTATNSTRALHRYCQGQEKPGRSPWIYIQLNLQLYVFKRITACKSCLVLVIRDSDGIAPKGCSYIYITPLTLHCFELVTTTFCRSRYCKIRICYSLQCVTTDVKKYDDALQPKQWGL